MVEYISRNDEGFETIRILLAGDPHLWENSMKPEREVWDIYRKGEEYGCSGLVVPGDVAKDYESIEPFFDSDLEDVFARIRMVEGNNDGFDMERAYEETMAEIGSSLTWSENGYNISMKHDPSRYDIRTGSGHPTNQNASTRDIIIAAHTHRPCSRVLNDGILYVNPGSIYRNYPSYYEAPERSLFVLSLGDDVGVTHLDYGSGEVFSKKIFGYDGEGFVEKDDMSSEEFEEVYQAARRMA